MGGKLVQENKNIQMESNPKRLAEEIERINLQIEPLLEDKIPEEESIDYIPQGIIKWSATASTEFSQSEKAIGYSGTLIQIQCEGDNEFFFHRFGVLSKTHFTVWNNKICMARNDPPMENIYIRHIQYIKILMKELKIEIKLNDLKYKNLCFSRNNEKKVKFKGNLNSRVLKNADVSKSCYGEKSTRNLEYLLVNEQEFEECVQAFKLYGKLPIVKVN